jgi:hypothetical protein
MQRNCSTIPKENPCIITPIAPKAVQFSNQLKSKLALDISRCFDNHLLGERTKLNVNISNDPKRCFKVRHDLSLT